MEREAKEILWAPAIMPRVAGLPSGPHHALVKHQFPLSTLAEIEQAAEKLSPAQKRELMLFLGGKLQADTDERFPRKLPPAERAADLQRWAASHERGPGLPDYATGRDAIYD